MQRAAEDYSPSLERLTIQIQLFRRRWATIPNLYAALVKELTSTDPLALNNICVGPFILPAGDLNAIWSLRDEHKPADQRGKTVEDWFISRNARTLNIDEPTQVNRATGGLRTPAVTMVNNTWAAKAKFAVRENLGLDYLPINIFICCQVPNPSVIHRRARWSTKDVNWQGFSGAVDTPIAACPLSLLLPRSGPASQPHPYFGFQDTRR